MASAVAPLYESPVDDRTLVRLGDLSYQEALREQARASAGTVDERDGLLLITGQRAHPILNYAVRTDAAVDAQVVFARARRTFDACGHGFTVVTMNAHDDSGMGAAAAAAGLRALASPPAMFCSHRLEDRALPSGIRLERVCDETGLASFREVSKTAWTTYGISEDVTAVVFTRLAMVASDHVAAVVAYDGATPLSCALVVLSHGVAGVYWVGTAPAGRGRGLAEACTRAVTNIGFDAGARMVTLQASPMGDPIYRRLGYRQIGSYSLYFSILPREDSSR